MRRGIRLSGTQRPQSAQSRSFFAVLAGFAFIGLVALDAQAPSKTRAHVQALASPRLEGRLAGSSGERLASDYIVSELQKIGAKPLPGQTDLRLPFEFTAGTKDGGSNVRLSSGVGCAPGIAGGVAGQIGQVKTNAGVPSDPCVRALSFSDNGDAEGAVVFAGYGIAVPEGQGFAYDSYATLDVKDKIV